MLVHEFVSPLPDVAHHVHHSERTGALRVSVHQRRTRKVAAFVWLRNSRVVPLISPRIQALVFPLGRILPLPFVRQPFAGPLRIGARVFQRYPGYWFILPASVRPAVLPIP